MPYHIGDKGSNGCSGYPVVSDKGHVAGCHATQSEANAQLSALYANVPDANKTKSSTGNNLWAGSAFGKSIEPEIISNSTYQGCDCEMCKEMNVDCPDCPICSNPVPETDSEVAMAMYDSSIGKASPCWDGYVQRGMKDQDGKQVPNCVPVAKTRSIFDGIGKDYTKSIKETHRIGE